MRLESTGTGGALPRALHLRISELEATQLEAYAERLAAERHAKVSVSEAARDLMAKGLLQDQKPWEVALRSLLFVSWQGGKPAIRRPVGTPQSSLSSLVLEDREDRL